MGCLALTGKLQVSSSIAHSSSLVVSFSSLHVPGEAIYVHAWIKPIVVNSVSALEDFEEQYLCRKDTVSTGNNMP